MNLNRLVYRTLIITVFSLSAVNMGCEGSFATGIELKSPENVTVKQYDEKSLKIKWSKVKGATEYEIYKANICLGGYRFVHSTKKTSWIDKKVDKNDTGTYKIMACKSFKDEYYESPCSYPVSAMVCTKKSKKRNASKVEAILNNSHSSKLTLNCEESIDKKKNRLSAKVYGPKRKGIKRRWRPLNGVVRWYSTDPSLVKVKSASNIRAGKKVGKCYIYAIAHNGVKSNKILVQVNSASI